MALLNSANSSLVFNFGTAVTLAGAEMDDSLGAVVRQVGGTHWQTNVQTISPGNLDGDNIPNRIGLPNSHKTEPYSIVRMTGSHMLSASPTQQVHYFPSAHQNMNLFAFGAGGYYVTNLDAEVTASSPEGYIALKANGAEVMPRIQLVKAQSSAGVFLLSRKTHKVNLDVNLNRGDILSVEFGGTTSFDMNSIDEIHWTFCVWARAEHIS